MAQTGFETGLANMQQESDPKTAFFAASHQVGAQAARYKQRQEWLNDTLKTVPKPYLRITLVFVGS